jgi:actin-like ATPase involved in cell morphogenesis
MAGHIYGVDLGTSNIKMFSLVNNGTINEKNVIAIKNKEEVFSFGDAAFDMLLQISKIWRYFSITFIKKSTEVRR